MFADGICGRIKRELLADFNLHTIIRLPQGVFAPYTDIPSNILFFDRGGPTETIWYYEQPMAEGRKKYSKTVPLQYDEFAPLLAWWRDRQESPQAWRVAGAEVLANNTNLDLKNPHAKQGLEHADPKDLVAAMRAKEQDVLRLLGEIEGLVCEIEP